MGTVDIVRTVVATLLVGLIAVNIALFVVHHASAGAEPVPIAAPSDHERLEAMGRVLKAQQDQIDSIGQPQGPQPFVRGVRGPTPAETAMIDQAIAAARR